MDPKRLPPWHSAYPALVREAAFAQLHGNLRWVPGPGDAQLVGDILWTACDLIGQTSALAPRAVVAGQVAQLSELMLLACQAALYPTDEQLATLSPAEEVVLRCAEQQREPQERFKDHPDSLLEHVVTTVRRLDKLKLLGYQEGTRERAGRITEVLCLIGGYVRARHAKPGS